MEIDHKDLVNGTGRSHNHLAQGKTTGLKILIAGAGIGGLSAALALRQAGHRVEVIWLRNPALSGVMMAYD